MINFSILLLCISGNEVMYIDLKDFLKMLTPTNVKQKVMGVVEAVTYHLNKGYHTVKSRSNMLYVSS